MIVPCSLYSHGLSYASSMLRLPTSTICWESHVDFIHRHAFHAGSMSNLLTSMILWEFNVHFTHIHGVIRVPCYIYSTLQFSESSMFYLFDPCVYESYMFNLLDPLVFWELHVQFTRNHILCEFRIHFVHMYHLYESHMYLVQLHVFIRVPRFHLFTCMRFAFIQIHAITYCTVTFTHMFTFLQFPCHMYFFIILYDYPILNVFSRIFQQHCPLSIVLTCTIAFVCVLTSISTHSNVLFQTCPTQLPPMPSATYLCFHGLWINICNPPMQA